MQPRIIPVKEARARLIGSGPLMKASNIKNINDLKKASNRTIGEVLDFLVEYAHGPASFDDSGERHYYLQCTASEFAEACRVSKARAEACLKALVTVRTDKEDTPRSKKQGD